MLRKLRKKLDAKQTVEVVVRTYAEGRTSSADSRSASSGVAILGVGFGSGVDSASGAGVGLGV